MPGCGWNAVRARVDLGELRVGKGRGWLCRGVLIARLTLSPRRTPDSRLLTPDSSDKLLRNELG